MHMRQKSFQQHAAVLGMPWLAQVCHVTARHDFIAEFAVKASRVSGLFAPIIASYGAASQSPNGTVYASASIFIATGMQSNSYSSMQTDYNSLAMVMLLLPYEPAKQSVLHLLYSAIFDDFAELLCKTPQITKSNSATVLDYY